MVESFPTINTSIRIKNKSTSSNYYVTGEVFNFKERSISRKVKYTKIVGGRVIPLLSNPLNYDVSFDFAVTGSDFNKLMNGSDFYYNMDDDDVNKFLVQLDFSNTTETYTKRYYDSYISEFQTVPTNEILNGKIIFTLPSRNLNGSDTIYTGSELTQADYYNTIMGY